MLTNCATRYVHVEVKVAKHGTIRYVRYGFLLDAPFFQIFDFKKMS